MARSTDRSTPDSRPGSIAARRQRVPNPVTAPLGSDAITEAVAAGRPKAQAAVRRQSEEVLRRQRLLRSVGYRLVVDGIWGPRSQKAWQDYNAKRAKNVLAFGPLKPETAAGVTKVTVAEKTQSLNLVTPEEIRAGREARRQEVRKLAQQRVARERAEVLARGRRIQLNPFSARTLTLRQLVSTVTDRETNLNPATSTAGAFATQDWLRGNGYKVEMTGAYDRQTHDALERAMKVETKREVAKSARALRNRVYRLLPDVRPGDRPSWWKHDGPIPDATELAREIATGSFSASVKLQTLLNHAFTGQAAFNQIRHAELLKLAAKVAPFGSVQIAKFLRDPNAVSNGSLLLDLLGVDNLAPMPDLSELTPAQQAWAAERWAENPDIRAENAERVAALRAEVRALASATDANDFKSKLLSYSRVEEVKFTRFQQQLAADSVPWWGKAIEKVLAPGEFFRTAVTYDAMRAFQVLEGREEGVRAVRWEDAMRTLGAGVEELPDYDGLVDEKANGLLRLGFELTTDPLNFAHPFRTGSSFLKYGTKGSQLGGYALRGGLRDADNLILRTRKSDVAGALFYTKGTWSKRGIYETLTGGVFQDAPHRALRQKAVALKDEAVASARERVAAASRTGFQPVTLSDGTKAMEVNRPRNKKTLKLLEEARVEMRKHVREMPELKPLLDSLIEGRVSLYVDKGRRYYSNVGASLLANLTEKARVGAANQLGVEYGWRVYDSHVDEWVASNPFPLAAEGDVDGRELIELLTSPADDAAEAARQQALLADPDVSSWVQQFDLDREAFARAAYDEYVGIVQGAGAYLRGGAASKEIQRITGQRATSRMDEVESTWLPVIQDVLEQEADAAFGAAEKSAAGVAEKAVHPLWDEGDLWAGRTGEFSGVLRSLGRESFEKPVSIPNPQFGAAHTWGEASELIEAEIRRRSPRVLAYASRSVAAGQLPDGFSVSEGLAAIRRDVTDAWQKVDGQWVDTRETVEVSDLYARNQFALVDQAQEWFKRGRQGRFVSDNPWVMSPAQLAETPLFSAASRTDDGLWRLSWMMGSRYKQLPGGFKATLGRRDAPSPPDGVVGDSATDFVNAEKSRQSAIYESLQKHQFALSRAYDEAMPSELFKEGAVMRAMAHATGGPLRWAYLGLKGMMDVWIFATLPLRPGWMVRNVIDNAAKLIVAGVHDPRMFFLGGSKPGQLVGSVFDLGLSEIREMIRFFDQLFGTNALLYWQSLENSIWELGSDALARIFKAHGVDVPEAALERSLFDPFVSSGLRSGRPRFDAEILGEKAPDPNAPKSIHQRFREGAWELMGNRPESYFKRVLYRDEYLKAERHLAGSGTEAEIAVAAHEAAWAKIEATLFDYSKITVTEDNFRVFFPFIQFWRKNTSFWANSFASKPWLSNAVLQLDAARREAHEDLPQWMRRYMHIDEITDAVAFIPGLDKVVSALVPDDVMYDPVNLLSFAPFYRTFKKTVYGDNQGLPPAETDGWPVVGPMLDALSDWGLGVAPWVRKPLESSGVASERAWQTVFPQTSVATALTRQWFGENVAAKIADWEHVFNLMMGDTPSEQIADNFTYYVQTEVAGQVARGETPSWTRAENTIKGWFATQNLWGYFTGMYLRRATTEDVYLAKMQDDLMTGGRDFESLSPRDKNLMKLWSMRGWDRLTYQKYIDLVPLIEAYYRADDWQTKVRLKRDHPELIRWVDAAWRGRPFKSKWTRNAQKYVDTEKFMMAVRLVETVDPPPAIRDAVIDSFKTPELEAYWRANDSPVDIRERMVRGAVFEYFNELNEQYHSIPDDDFEARDGFLDEHPELVRHWNRNNDPADDFEATIRSANAAAREAYFAVVKSSGWDAAAPLLKAIPFMFEDTKSARKVNEATGEWITGMNSDGTWKSGWSAERSAAFRKARPHLRWFFDGYMKRVGEKAAWAWLEKSDGEAALILKDYFKRYGKKSAKALAYLKARPWLELYFDMPEELRGKWLRGNSEGAAIVRWYFDNYASPKGLTQHARDYLSVRSSLNYYFSLPKQKRRDWLNGASAEARDVLQYFKKYGSNHRMERAFKRLGSFNGGTPEQRKRLEFWRRYYALSPDQRPAFVLKEAENHGVFIYGEFGEQERHDREQEYLRRAIGLGASKRQSDYLYVKPLLDFYFQLPEDERALFQRANPEIAEYLSKYSDRKVTGDARLDGLIEQYFRLPPDSLARSRFLRDHPDVQDWFDERSSPAERAMRNLLEQYFSIQGKGRADFLVQRPEIAAYFERRRSEKSNETAAYDAFDRADPRLAPFFDEASELLKTAAYIRDRLKRSAMNALAADEFSTRRERASSR